MIIGFGPINDVIRSQKEAVKMSPEQKVLFKNEIITDPTLRGYAGKTPAEIIELLSLDYIDVINEIPLIDRYSWKPDELENFFLKAKSPNGRAFFYNIEKFKSSGIVALEELAIMVTAVINSKIKEVVLADNIELIAGLQSLASPEIAALSVDQFNFLIKMPDPNFNPNISRQSRMKILFDGPYIPTIEEVEEALI